MTKAGRLIGILAVFGIAAAAAYWIYLYLSEGSAPSFSDLWSSFSGGFTNVTGIGKLKFADIQPFAANAGFSGDDLNTACAIALAESSGNPNAKGDLTLAPTNGPSIGLWQINTGSKAHPELAGQDLTDPQTNANAAFAIYQAAGNSFSPWSTFGSGAYTKYLPATAAASDQDTTASVAGVPATGSATETSGDNSGAVEGATDSMVGGS